MSQSLKTHTSTVIKQKVLYLVDRIDRRVRERVSVVEKRITALRMIQELHDINEKVLILYTACLVFFTFLLLRIICYALFNCSFSFFFCPFFFPTSLLSLSFSPSFLFLSLFILLPLSQCYAELKSFDSLVTAPIDLTTLLTTDIKVLLENYESVLIQLEASAGSYGSKTRSFTALSSELEMSGVEARRVMRGNLRQFEVSLLSSRQSYHQRKQKMELVLRTSDASEKQKKVSALKCWGEFYMYLGISPKKILIGRFFCWQFCSDISLSMCRVCIDLYYIQYFPVNISFNTCVILNLFFNF